jgi:hypothetical protein
MSDQIELCNAGYIPRLLDSIATATYLVTHAR